MSESAAPWRALEDAATADSPRDGVTETPPPATGSGIAAGLARTPWTFGALLVAAILGGVAVVIVAAGGHGSVVVEGGGLAVGGSPPASSTGAAGSADGLVVDVQGAVVRPGIVHLSQGARVADAIAAAGGYGPRVAADRIADALNLASVVKDGDKIVVPSRDDPATAGGGGSGGGSQPGATAAATGERVDLNHASASELDALPGIGPVTAAKIIAARDEQPFTSVDDLRTRKIVGASAFDKIKDLVVVR